MGVLRHMAADWPVFGLFRGVAAAGGWRFGRHLARRPWRRPWRRIWRPGAAPASVLGAGGAAGFVMRPALDLWHPFAGSPEAAALPAGSVGWIVTAAYRHFDSAVSGTLGVALAWLLAGLAADRAAGRAAGAAPRREGGP